VRDRLVDLCIVNRNGDSEVTLGISVDRVEEEYSVVYWSVGRSVRTDVEGGESGRVDVERDASRRGERGGRREDGASWCTSGSAARDEGGR
jgi:hypothetical protein